MNKRKVQTILCVKKAEDFQFLLLKMNKRRNYFWQNVTGSVEENETFFDAALREAMEETGLSKDNIEKTIPLDLSFEFTDQWDNQVLEKVFLILCKRDWDIKLDPTEHDEFRWIDARAINRTSVHYETNYNALLLARERLTSGLTSEGLK